MDKDASSQLGEPVNAGILMLAHGSSKRFRFQGMFGLLGVAVAAALNRKKKQPVESSEVIAPKGGGFIAVTPSRVVLFSIESGAFRSKLGAPLATFRRGDLVGIELGKAAFGVATVNLVLPNRQRYCFELVRMLTKKLQPVADALGIAVTG